jgi:CRISPR-associated protein Cas1
MRRRIVISSYGIFIGSKGGRIVIKRKEDVLAEIPAFEIFQVVMDTKGASISTSAMRLLMRNGAELLITDGTKVIGKLSPARRGANVNLRMRQYDIRDGREGLELAKTFVRGKLINQSDMLKSLAKNRDDPVRGDLRRSSIEIERIAREVEGAESTGSLLSLEAEAGKIYWSSIAEILPPEVGFESRKKKYEDPSDPFNIILNYLYSILMSESWFCLEAVGLDPFIGFLHSPSNRRPALAADFMEEFRQPVADRVALSVIQELPDPLEGNRLSSDAKRRILRSYEERMRTHVTFRNRKLSIRTHMKLQAERLAGAILGRAQYRPFRVKW